MELGTLKKVTGVTVVDTGYSDLFDGTIDSPINISETGGTVNQPVHSNTNQYGQIYSTNANALACSNWSTNTSDWSYGTWTGNSSLNSAGWLSETNSNRNCTYSFALYCIEDIDSAADTTPSAFSLPYAIQTPTSSRQTSSAVVIGGMSSGATTTLSVAAFRWNTNF